MSLSNPMKFNIMKKTVRTMVFESQRMFDRFKFLSLLKSQKLRKKLIKMIGLPRTLVLVRSRILSHCLTPGLIWITTANRMELLELTRPITELAKAQRFRKMFSIKALKLFLFIHVLFCVVCLCVLREVLCLHSTIKQN